MLDCIIIGGGPAGLTAATYLARFRRSAILIDAGESRMRRIPKIRNFPGFPDGISGLTLHSRMLVQASKYGARIVSGRVERITSHEQSFAVQSRDAEYQARAIILATGSKLNEYVFPALDKAVARALIRYCPICDGFETRGKAIAVLSEGEQGLSEATFLRTFAAEVDYLLIAGGVGAEERRRAARDGVRIIEDKVTGLRIAGERIEAQLLQGAPRVYDAIYPSLGCVPQSELAERLNIQTSADRGIITDAHRRTNLAGFYAVGDVLKGVDQIAAACGDAAVAATALHNELREVEQVAASPKDAVLS